MFPVYYGLFSVKVRTLLFNGDKDLRCFLWFVLSVLTFFERDRDELAREFPSIWCFGCQIPTRLHARDCCILCKAWAVVMPLIACPVGVSWCNALTVASMRAGSFPVA